MMLGDIDGGSSSAISSKSYGLGNEAFVAEKYSEAIQFYSDALKESPEWIGPILLSRSHAFIKNENYLKAKNDADKVIDLYRAQNTAQKDPKAYLRSGIASFHMAKYQEAKNCFSEGLKISQDSGLRQWITWCEEKMQKLGINSNQDKKSDNKKVESDVSVPPPAPVAGIGDSITPKIKYDYYQTDSTVVVEVRIKGLKASDVTVDFTKTTLSVSAKLPGGEAGREYNLELDLCHPINQEESTYRVMSTKIEIKMKKGDFVRWPTLEGDGTDPQAKLSGVASSSKSTYPGMYPSSSGKNWNKIEVDINKELENDKPEGEAALNEMFQKIYSDGSDEVRKAMNKSFQESGGTVLSTNWNDIKKDKVEVKPPEGVEFKKWN